MSKELATALEPEVPQEEIQAAEQELGQQPTAETPKEEPQEEKAKVVPHQALHEERERRKQVQRELEETRRQQAAREAVLQDRLTQLFQASQQQNQPQMRDPNRDPDPVGAIVQNQQVTAQQLQQMQYQMQQEQAQRQHAAQLNGLVNWAKGKAAEFSKETPDFGDAYKHLIGTRAAELQAMGLAPAEVEQALANDEIWVYQHAAQTGKNPAEIAYNMAKAAGYKPGGQPNAQQKVETLQKGVEASKKLGNGAVDGVPTPEQIANMTDDQFAELKQKLKKKGMSISDVL